LPTTWVFDAIRAALRGMGETTLFHLALLWSFSASSVFILSWLAGVVYFPGFSKAQTTPERLFRTSPERSRIVAAFLGFLSTPARAYAVKEIKTFFRDQTQWPQLFLIVALIVVYVYNFSVLPLEKSPIRTVYLQNTISFLNMALASFVLTAIAARFVYPAISLESHAFWIVKSSPIKLRTFLWIKFFVYYIPLIVLAEILIVATNVLLQVTPFIMILSTATIFFMVPGIVALGIGLGAMYPDFASENPAQAVTSFGGLLFMILCALFIGLVIVIEAGPVYAVFMADFRGLKPSGWIWIRLVGSLGLVIILCILAVILPMRFGERHLENFSRG
jgi:ABC-2 type transport system permease protein